MFLRFLASSVADLTILTEGPAFGGRELLGNFNIVEPSQEPQVVPNLPAQGGLVMANFFSKQIISHYLNISVSLLTLLTSLTEIYYPSQNRHARI